MLATNIYKNYLSQHQHLYSSQPNGGLPVVAKNVVAIEICEDSEQSRDSQDEMIIDLQGIDIDDLQMQGNQELSIC